MSSQPKRSRALLSQALTKSWWEVKDPVRRLWLLRDALTDGPLAVRAFVVLAAGNCLEWAVKESCGSTRSHISSMCEECLCSSDTVAGFDWLSGVTRATCASAVVTVATRPVSVLDTSLDSRASDNPVSSPDSALLATPIAGLDPSRTVVVRIGSASGHGCQATLQGAFKEMEQRKTSSVTPETEMGLAGRQHPQHQT